jgi:hypothetical protein
VNWMQTRHPGRCVAATAVPPDIAQALRHLGSGSGSGSHDRQRAEGRRSVRRIQVSVVSWMVMMDRGIRLARATAVRALARCVLVVIGCSALASCTPPAAQAPPLEPEDFLLSGLPHDADSAEIRLSFGEPDSIIEEPNPFDAQQPIESWHYAGFLIRYTGDAAPSSFLITGGDEATLRGVRVGDSADRVLRLYGQPPYRYESVWTYVDPLDADGVYVIEFLVEDDVVTRIHLGRAHE